MTNELTAFCEATVRTAAPLTFAALGETVVERSGIINIGLEGSIIAGALAALVAAGHGGVWSGFATAAIAGASIAAVFAIFTVVLRADQIITGTAMSMLALGGTGAVYRMLYGDIGAALTTPTMDVTTIPLLATIPIIGPALFAQPSITYALYGLVPLVWWWMSRTHGGLALRAIGESPDAALAAGIAPRRLQFAALMFGGVLGGVSGGMLVLAQAGTFAEGMSAGRGFIAIAIVVLGRWSPVGTAIAALVFGAASALQFLFQAMGWAVPYQIFLALPYVLTLVGLAGVRGRAYAPAALGR